MKKDDEPLGMPELTDSDSQLPESIGTILESYQMLNDLQATERANIAKQTLLSENIEKKFTEYAEKQEKQNYKSRKMQVATLVVVVLSLLVALAGLLCF